MIQRRIKTAIGLTMWVALLFSLHILRPMPLAAQVAGATLSGLITDSSGASIANANLVVKNVGTAEVREVSSNGEGLYSAPNLLPGTYEVTASANVRHQFHRGFEDGSRTSPEWP
jgi:hypothetical protein